MTDTNKIRRNTLILIVRVLLEQDKSVGDIIEQIMVSFPDINDYLRIKHLKEELKEICQKKEERKFIVKILIKTAIERAKIIAEQDTEERRMLKIERLKRDIKNYSSCDSDIDEKLIVTCYKEDSNGTIYTNKFIIERQGLFYHIKSRSLPYKKLSYVDEEKKIITINFKEHFIDSNKLIFNCYNDDDVSFQRAVPLVDKFEHIENGISVFVHNPNL